jgi:hypothetical protein
MSSTTRKMALSLTAIPTALLSTALTAPQATAADLVLAPGAYTVNTTTLKLTGPGTNRTGVNVGGVAVFKFGSIKIPNGVTITAKGTRPLELLATHGFVLGGTIVADGTAAVNQTATPGKGGPGGGAGGTGGDTSGPDWVPATAGHGPGGGGVPSDQQNGAGGGGFGGKGAAGGIDDGDPGTGGARGTAYGNLNVKLQGGSGGGGSSDVGGGGGGGAVALVGATVTIKSTAVVSANGGDGAGGGNGASGGGSGGAIVVNGNSVGLSGNLEASGGDGGGGGCCGDAGGGAGGRIAIQYKTYSLGAVTISTAGGTSGVIDYSHGGLSPQAKGAHGVSTFTHIDISKLTIGNSKTISKGDKVTIKTRLTDRSTGKPIAKQRVTLYKRASYGAPWHKVAAKTTSPKGTASVGLKLKSSAQFQWRYDGTWVHDPARSPRQSIKVTP